MQAGQAVPGGDVHAANKAVNKVDNTTKIITMITKEQLLEAFTEALVIVPQSRQDDEGVFLGFVSILDPAGLDAILQRYTGYIDKLLQTLPLTTAQYIELITSRCFAYEQYRQLWQAKPHQIKRCILAKVLLMTTEEERQLFISVAQDDTHDSFVHFLKTYTERHNPFLYHFLYEIYA